MRHACPIRVNRLARGAAATLWLIMLANQFAHSQDAAAVALQRIYGEYISQRSAPDVARLVLLDQQLRELIPKHHWQGRGWMSARYYRTEYEEIGVSLTLFDSDTLSYSGNLLAEAHAGDPNSRYRSYTLYSAIFDEWGKVSPGMPSPVAAEAYVREFPAGPFIVHAYMALAHFYDDLFKVVALEIAGRRVDYKYDCYRAHLNESPLLEQQRTAQQLAIRYYERLLELLPGNETGESHLSSLREGRASGWFYCGD